MNRLPKTKKKPYNTSAGKDDGDRETKILNVLCNTSLLLMAALTEAFSEVFTNLSKEMMKAFTANLDPGKDHTKSIDDLHTQLPKHLREELIAMKADLTKQLSEKKQELGPLLSDPRFDHGITIVERIRLPLPKLTEDLDERSLLSYLALLQAQDPRFTPMFQELLEWMKALPQPSDKK